METNSRAISTVTQRAIMSMTIRSRTTTSKEGDMAGIMNMAMMVAMGTARMHMGSSNIMTATIHNEKTMTKIACGDLTHRITKAWAVVRFTHGQGLMEVQRRRGKVLLSQHNICQWSCGVWLAAGKDRRPFHIDNFPLFQIYIPYTHSHTQSHTQAIESRSRSQWNNEHIGRVGNCGFPPEGNTTMVVSFPVFAVHDLYYT